MESLIPKFIIISLIFIVIIYLLKSSFSTKFLYSKRRSRYSYEDEAKRIEAELEAESKKKQDKIKQVAEYTQKNPQQTASILSNWFLKDEEEDKLT